MSNVFSLKKPGLGAQDHGLERNPGMDFSPELFDRLRINRSAVERRTAHSRHGAPSKRTTRRPGC